MTFLAYPEFDLSALVLDRRRLGKQRVECLQILNALAGRSKGWRNHPAVVMWRGHEEALRQYMRAVILEWVGRGYQNNMTVPEEAPAEPPGWLGRADVHASHRAVLLRKEPGWYGQFGWDEVGLDAEYVWPGPVQLIAKGPLSLTP